jgi:MFS family permease
MPVDSVALAGVVLIFGTMTYTFAVATAVFVAITPNRLRGQMIALYLLVGNLFGLGLGPFSVGFCLDHVLHSPHPVGLALALVALAAGLPGALLLRSSLPAYIALRAELSE